MRLATKLVTVMGGGEAIPWYRLGGIANSNVVLAYLAKGVTDISASYINLVNPGTNNATPGASGPTWDAASGWIFGVTGTALLGTGVTNPANSWTFIVKANITDAGSSTAGTILSGAGDTLYIRPDNNANGTAFRNGSTVLTVAGNSRGNHVLVISNTNVYKDGTDIGDIVQNALGAGEVVIGNRATTDRQCNGSIQAVAIYNTTLTDAQIGAVSAHMLQNF